MGTLLLDSLEIRRFRVFQHLRLEKLGRVNLIVGQNNVGKSCLLEALQLYANRAHPSFLWRLLEAHDQDTRSALSSPDHYVDEHLSIVKRLFHGWPAMTGQVEPIEIGPIGSTEKTLWLSFGFCTSKVNEQGQTTLQLLFPDKYKNVENAISCFSVQVGGNYKILYPLETISSSSLLKTELQPIHCIVTDTNSLNKGKISELWDNITAPDLHQEIIRALRLLTPGLQDFSVTENTGTQGERLPIVTVSSVAEPVPIRMLGTGMQRILTMVLSLLNAKDGLLLIDEIENGLHHTIQLGLWKLIFEMSHRFNIQVFATSHSWDCIVSFQQAARENEQVEGMLIRLEPKKGEVKSTLFNEEDLAILTREEIEVR